MNKKTLIFAVIIMAAVIIMISSADNGLESERLETLAQAVHKSAVSCYAIEGFYPADIEYLKENYGLIVDESKYTVIYDVFASNILPDITVLSNET